MREKHSDKGVHPGTSEPERVFHRFFLKSIERTDFDSNWPVLSVLSNDCEMNVLTVTESGHHANNAKHRLSIGNTSSDFVMVFEVVCVSVLPWTIKKKPHNTSSQFIVLPQTELTGVRPYTSLSQETPILFDVRGVVGGQNVFETNAINLCVFGIVFGNTKKTGRCLHTRCSKS